MFVESIDIKRGNLMLHSYLGPNCYSPIRASSVSPLDWVGSVSEISPYLWILSVKFSLCSSEREGWLGFPDLGVSTLISVSCGLKIFAIWTLQPGYRDESGMNCSNEFCINCSDTAMIRVAKAMIGAKVITLSFTMFTLFLEFHASSRKSCWNL